MKRIPLVLLAGLALAGCASPMQSSSNPGVPTCVNTVARQIASSHAVQGSFECLAGDLATQAAAAGVQSDQDFASVVGHDGTFEYVGRARDGHYLYEFTADGRSYSYSFAINATGKVVSAG